MMDLNALRNNINNNQKEPTPSPEESIAILEGEVEHIQKRLEDFKTTPPAVNEEGIADGVSPQSIIELWEMRLEVTKHQLEILKGKGNTQ